MPEKIVQLSKKVIERQIKELVHGNVEETLNKLKVLDDFYMGVMVVEE